MGPHLEKNNAALIVRWSQQRGHEVHLTDMATITNFFCSAVNSALFDIII